MLQRQQRCIGVFTVSVVVLTLIFILGVQLHIMYSHRSLAERVQYFERKRDTIILRERLQHVGGRIDMGIKEVFVNNRLLIEKLIDRDDNFIITSNASQTQLYSNQFDERLARKPLFKLIKTMPKGAALNVNDFAMCSRDCLLQLTYRENLWICVNHRSNTSRIYEAFRFSLQKPHQGEDGELQCEWVLLEALRARETNSIVDDRLRSHFALNSEMNPVNSLTQIERLLEGLLTYEPLWHLYLRNSLREFHEDNVQYVEVYTTLPRLYNLDGTNFTYMDTANIINKVVMSYCAHNSGFSGAMIIYEYSSKDDSTDLDGFLERALKLKEVFPEFIAGINLADRENSIGSLRSLARKFLRVQDDLNYFYSAHPNDVVGLVSDDDDNVMDAVLFGSKHIAADFELLRHPELLRVMRRSIIAVEVSPTTILYQKPQHVFELRNHASAHLFATNYPLIVTSKYAGFWNMGPLTLDYYLTFIGITARTADLGTLKQLAWNSLHFSNLDLMRRHKVYREWTHKWDSWIDEIMGNDS